MTSGDLLAVFFAVFIGALGFGQAVALIPDIMKAKAAASRLFAVIERKPLLDENPDGKTPQIQGQITFKNVFFKYPTRPEVTVLKKFSLKVKPGRTIALVGHSGSGKSSVIQLIERFYDVTRGKILIDGIDIRDINLQHLRQSIGLVSQEPILFKGTIADNIRHGKPSATEDEIIEAAKRANAHDFIMKLADKYNTEVGERGTQVSGGQKQRIAIARAIMKSPKILLLDEATSALDAESEELVQSALAKLQVGRTTIIVAHRLSTIQHADTIFVLDNGKIVEQGTHDQLLKLDAHYASLVALQIGATPTE